MIQTECCTKNEPLKCTEEGMPEMSTRIITKSNGRQFFSSFSEFINLMLLLVEKHLLLMYSFHVRLPTQN